MANLNLKDENKANVYSDTFIHNVNNKTLSDKEVEWGAKCVDDMIRGIYTEEELRKLNAAGIDPASGIMVDGKPVDFYPGSTSTVFSKLSDENSGKIKCQIIAKALEGKKLDVIKYGVDENGVVSSKEAVPVNTQVKISSRSSSWFRRLLEAIGLVSPKLDPKIEAANKEQRDYSEFFAKSATSQEERDRFKNEMNVAKDSFEKDQLDNIKVKTPENPDMLSRAERHAISMQYRAEAVKLSNLKKQMDVEFFDDFVPETLKPNQSLDWAIGSKVIEKFRLTSEKNPKLPALDHSITRINTRTSLAILYGMTQGHSLDEMTAPENSELRKSVGRDFVRNMGTQTIEDFAKSKGIEQNDPETKKQYQKYFIEQRSKIEKFFIDSYEKLRLEPIDYPDPNKYTEFAQKFTRLSLMSGLIKEIEQTPVNLAKGSFDSSTPEDMESRDRYNAVFNYVQNETGVLKTTHLGNYYAFVASPDFANGRTEKNTIATNLAAQGKAAAQYLHDKTKDMDYYARLMDNEELCANLLGLCEKNANCEDEDLADAAYANFVCTNDPDMKTVLYDENSKRMLQFGVNNEKGAIFDTNHIVNDRINKGVKARSDLGKYISGLGILRESGLTLSDKYVEDVIEKPLREKAGAEKTETLSEKNAEPISKTEAEKSVDMAEQEKEQFIKNAMKDRVSREQAEQLWKSSEHDKKFAKELDELIREADENMKFNQSESRQKVTLNELTGNTNQKVSMPSKEIHTPSKQMGKSMS